jgi:peptidoglycan/LPS O-acetylase OafA/YrhL
VHDGLVFAGAMTTAWLSFRYFESPFLKLKEQFTIVVSTAALDNAAPEEHPRSLAA